MIAQADTFRGFLDEAFDNGNYATDDVIAFVLPLFKEVLSFHEAGLVGPFEKEESLFITDGRLDIDENCAHRSADNSANVKALTDKLRSHYFEIVGKKKLEADVDEGTSKWEDLTVNTKPNDSLEYPAYVPGYSCYEILLGHHDAQTDIFCLGLVLGGMSLGLDLYDEEDLKLFVTYRTTPARYNERIHPAVSSLITEMTELDRSKRAQDLYEAIQRLEHYRDYDPEKQTDLSKLAGWINKDLTERSQFILSKLRNRLFDTSRRNRLMYYKPNMRFVNLTVSSVPMVLHYQSIRPELLFTWNEEISSKVKGMKDIVLNKYLRFEDHIYLSSSLDKIRVEAIRDKNEFGFSQLKLVVAFMNWHNLKEDKRERIQSPLLLIPVELVRNKKLKEDHYVLKISDNAAEVNPVLANYLRELYGIKLPDFVDLDEMSVQQFYDLLKAQIEGAGQGILLNYIDKPRIKLIHSVAKQTVSNYRKRLKRGKQMSSYRDISYSYQSETYKPLGLEIFRQRVEPRSSFLEFLVNEDVSISSHHLTGDGITKERSLFQLAESESNPYSWDFDVCNIVLGNFNYKKMSLVRDYNHVIDTKLENGIFEKVFSQEPKQHKDIAHDLNNPEDWFHVITADPTQTNAILLGRTGESYIIQGPPGTGKSQTITNLIADFVAKGKNILFVCEKRAALDVVYYRLKQQGLDELCCYIHDSQGDKREFVKNLKATYEDFIKNKMNLSAIREKRNTILEKIRKELEIIRQFHETCKSQPEIAGTEVRKLVERIVELKSELLPLDKKQEETFPHFKEWQQFGVAIRQLSKSLEETGAEPAFADHPFSKLHDKVFASDQPNSLLENLVAHAGKLVNEINSILNTSNVPAEFTQPLNTLKNLVGDAIALEPLAESNNLKVVEPGSNAAQTFDKDILSYRQKQNAHQLAQQHNSNWKNKFSEQDTHQALELAAKHEKSFFSFLNGNWRALKKNLHNSYNFSAHQVKPAYSKILQSLKAEYAAMHAATETRKELENRFGVRDLEGMHSGVEHLRKKRGDREIDFLVQHPEANELVRRLSKLNNQLHQLELHLQQSLENFSDKSIDTIRDELDSIGMNTDSLNDLLPALRNFSALPAHLKKVVREIPMSPGQAEANMAHRTLNTLYQNNKGFAAVDFNVIENAARKIQTCYKQLLRLNAELIRAEIRQKFLKNVDLSNAAASQLNSEQKKFKKVYFDGRKILENEFGKSMRYKSIRELAGKESGAVLKDLKPVWLMSPLSVSDSLPVDTNFFDVVIFDEASQITLEEGVPALYRAPQTIIVGDDKQMPPTNFFTAKAEDPDDLEKFAEESEDELLSTDADSLLVQGARKLNSVMLGWHYRSKYETLISYSNHAFYEAGLLTIPDKTVHHKEKIAIEVTISEDASKFADALFDRSISFHFHPNSVYEKRINMDEANYIAHLVRELLKRKIKENIGIVAFSQEQQHTIEDALTQLASTDKVFEEQLEEAYSRTEEDQFVGLFVKNLENVQGDERDIIIMSVCYGFDAKKRIIMNFGPINKKGGEKRLNVIFSRAKKHMAIVSSIKHFNITNEYNEGANYFKRFLHYAENVSCGSMQAARSILDGLNPNKKEAISVQSKSVILTQIKNALEKQGYEVADQVGQSDFKCSLAVKSHRDDDNYTLSILLDDDHHYSNNNLLEQYYQRPAILKNFGWRILPVFAKDWLHQPDKVLEQIVKRLTEEPKEESEEVEELQIPSVDSEETSNTNPVDTNVLPVQPTPATTPYDHLTFKRFAFADETSNKFWEAAVDDARLIIRFGRIGTKGQVQVKTYKDAEQAEREREKMIREKTGKGYVAS